MLLVGILIIRIQQPVNDKRIIQKFNTLAMTLIILQTLGNYILFINYFNIFQMQAPSQLKILASKSHLKRFWPLQNRRMAYTNSIQYLTSTNRNPNQYCIVIIQRFVNGHWIDQIYFAPKTAPLNFLYKKLTGTSKDAFFFKTTKTHVTVLVTKTFQELWENLRDPDDGFVYLELVGMDAFGGINSTW